MFKCCRNIFDDDHADDDHADDDHVCDDCVCDSLFHNLHDLYGAHENLMIFQFYFSLPTNLILLVGHIYFLIQIYDYNFHL